jgi:hypothetical protein
MGNALESVIRKAEVMGRKKLYDAEFAPQLINTLKKREILGQANPAQLVPLRYNMSTEGMEKKFQGERAKNPLLATAPPEAWTAALRTSIKPVWLRIKGLPVSLVCPHT